MRAEDCTPSAPSNSASASPRRYLVRCFGSLRLLYLNERLGLAVSTATRSIGAFNGAVHLAAVLSGVVTDRWLGTRLQVTVGRPWHGPSAKDRTAINLPKCLSRHPFFRLPQR